MPNPRDPRQPLHDFSEQIRAFMRGAWDHAVAAGHDSARSKGQTAWTPTDIAAAATAYEQAIAVTHNLPPEIAPAFALSPSPDAAVLSQEPAGADAVLIPAEPVPVPTGPPSRRKAGRPAKKARP